MKTKTETSIHLANFVNHIETQFALKIKTIRSYNGQEFLFKSFYDSKGTVHQLTSVETPQQNGIAKKKHQRILNIARALTFQANLPISFWSFAVQ